MVLLEKTLQRGCYAELAPFKPPINPAHTRWKAGLCERTLVLYVFDFFDVNLCDSEYVRCDGTVVVSLLGCEPVAVFHHQQGGCSR